MTAQMPLMTAGGSATELNKPVLSLTRARPIAVSPQQEKGYLLFAEVSISVAPAPRAR